jgi:hypothetical protein
VFALVAVLATPAAGQVIAPAQNTVTGVVVDSVSGKTLRSVGLYFTSRVGDDRTDRDGRFRIQRTSPSDTVLVLRTIGYVPAYVLVPSSSSAAVIDIGRVALGPVATRLDRIAVEAEEVRLYPHLEDFYRRKREGIAGDFITREDIERTSVRKTSELLSRSAKVSMDCPHDAVKTGDENCLPKDRRGLRAGYRVLDNNFGGCEKEVFVDGRLSTLGVDEVPVSQIAAVEIYAGPATTPANFGQRRCGVIAIWTTGTKGG